MQITKCMRLHQRHRADNERRPPLHKPFLAAAAGAAATAAAVATAVSGHDAAAEAAGGRVAQVDQACQGVGGVDGASGQWSVISGQWRTNCRVIGFSLLWQLAT